MASPPRAVVLLEDVAALFTRDARNRIRQLIKLGTGKLSAILARLSRKGYWRLSRTHTGMTNAWLAEQGVISLKELWVNIHYPKGKASKHRLPR